jgi:hypothetical protein
MKLGFGALVPKIAKQLKSQKIEFKAEEIDTYQKDADAAVRLKVRQLLSDSEANKVFRKIFKNIEKSVEQKKKAPKPVSKCRVVLSSRHYGTHSPVKECELPLPLSHYARKINGSEDEYIVREKKLLEDLPEKFLPVKPYKILIVVKESGQCKLKLFRNWGKYFDCYSLTLE